MIEFIQTRDFADIIVRADSAKLSHVFAIAIYSLNRAHTNVYLDGEVRDDKIYIRYGDEYIPFHTVSSIWNHIGIEPALHGKKNRGNLHSLVRDYFIRKIDNDASNDDVVSCGEVINVFFTAYPIVTAYEKAIEIAKLLLEKEIDISEKAATDQVEMDVKLSEATGHAVKVEPYSYWIQAFWRSDVKNNVKFVVIRNENGTYRFVGIPCGKRPYTDVLVKIPEEWLKYQIERVREITGVAGLISLEKRGFGGVCKTEADAFAMVEAICGK